MGNFSSVEEDESLEEQDQVKPEDVDLDMNLIDFSCLFNTEALHKALLTIKEPPGNVLSRFKDPLIKWLKSLVDRGETTINMVQFVDFMASKSTRDEAIETFNELDPEEEGLIDITRFLAILKDNPPEPMQALQPCHDLPGSLDIYLGGKSKINETSKKILQFIHRHRVDSNKIVMPIVAQMGSIIKQRSKLVEGRFFALKQRESDQELLRNGDEDEEVDETSEKLLITKCYSKISVSTNSKTVDNLLNLRTENYWQSNGSPRSHWIRIHMLPGVMVRELGVSVSSTDDSYMPKNLTISVGNSENNLKEIKKLTVPRETTGKFVLLHNLTTEYRFVQINIKGCYSDGCDVRIRALHVKGCKFIKEVEPSVLDTMATWYLGIVSSTALAAMPLAPHLRQLILDHSKSSLKHLPPLSLSPFSPTKPEFLSSFVLKEMDKFLTNICLPKDSEVNGESLQVLLSFALAHGNVNNLIDLIMTFLENLSVKPRVAPLLRKMDNIMQHKSFKHSESLKLNLVSCDGGQKNDEHKPDFIFTNVPSSSGSKYYISEKDKKIVTIVAKEDSDLLITVTRLKVKVQPGDQGAKAGVVLLSKMDPTTEKLAEKLKTFDSWTADDYKNFDRTGFEEEGELIPIAFFEMENESNEVDFIPDVSVTGNYLTLKFFGPKKEDADRIGVQAVQVFGHRNSEATEKRLQFLKQLDSLSKIPPDFPEVEPVSVETVIIRVLYFLGLLMRDLSVVQTRRKAASLDSTVLSESHLAVENLSLEKIWKFYEALSSKCSSSDLHRHGSLLCLYLLRTSLPFIRPPTKSRSKSDPPIDPLTIPSAVLSHLCGLLDSTDTEDTVKWLAQDIVTEGVVVFFPDAKARKDYLLSMIGSVLDENQPKSWWLKFEALCQYFSKTDSKSVLGLPSKPADITMDSAESVLSILNTMIVVAKREALSYLKTGSSKSDDLVQLLCALQASLFFWCQSQLPSEEHEDIKKAVNHLLVSYVDRVSESSVELLRELQGKTEDDLKSMSKLMEKSVLGRVLPEMVVCLGMMVDVDVERLELLDCMQPLLTLLTVVCSNFPSSIAEASKSGSSQSMESIVGVWTRESSHNYENNSRVSEEFYCPSAVRFTLEFDSRCHTERRYDYLEFTDESGKKVKCDGEVGQERWPLHIDFKGHKIAFSFYSDSSNNYWGYKFTLKAYGHHAFSSLHWLSDLNISLCHLLGRLCGAVLTTRPPASFKGEKTKVKDGEREDEVLVNSELWKTLFRGGYMTGKLTRSLSGAYAAKPADAEVSAVLNDLANGPEGLGVKLVEKCREALKGQYYGGTQVDTAVNTVFAALIWNSQECREELSEFVTRSDVATLTPGLLSAFKFAEFMRRDLVEARQKLSEAKEKEVEEGKKEKINEDAPVLACQEKAQYLLKFAGVSRIPLKKAGNSDDSLQSRPSWANKGKNWSKISAAVSTVGKLKQHLQETSEREKINEKYPSFELVLNFVRTESLSVEQVHSLLEQRSDMARMVSHGYDCCAKIVKTLGVENLFELPGLVFLQQLLTRQRHFPKHYAAKLDGCGLELENNVRRAYRNFIMELIEAHKSYIHPPTKDHEFARLLVLVYLLHLLDFDWQDYDHALLNELNLTELYVSNAISCSAAKEKKKVVKFEGEDEMLKRYKFHMELMEKYKSRPPGTSWSYLVNSAEGEEQLKETRLFVIAIAHEFKIGVQCDGCGSSITTHWYRDMDIQEDCDLCSRCFESGEGSRPASCDKDDMFQAIGKFGCDDCKMALITHRFHSNTRHDFDLCMGCFRKEEATGRSDEWTIYLLKEQPAMSSKSHKYLSMYPVQSTGCFFKDGTMVKLGPSADLGIYAQHHCWLLFSSLTLSMAHTVNNCNSGNSEIEYLQQAGNIKYLCLKFLAFILRAALLAKLEEGDEKRFKKDIKDEVEEVKKVQDEENLSLLPSSRIVVDSLPHGGSAADGGSPVLVVTLADETDHDSKQVPMETASDVSVTSADSVPMETETVPTPKDSFVTPVDPVPMETVPSSEESLAKSGSKETELTVSSKDPSSSTSELASGSKEIAEAETASNVESGSGLKLEPLTAVESKSSVVAGSATISSNSMDTSTSKDDVSSRQTEGTDMSSKSAVESELGVVESDFGVVEGGELDESDPVIVASRRPREMDSTIGELEKTYGLLALEKALGLLAAMLPQEMSLSPWIQQKQDIEVFLVQDLLPILLQLSSCGTVQESLQLQSLLVAANYLAHLNPEVADRVIDVARGDTLSPTEQLECRTHGTKTVQFLFSLGADFLIKSQFSGAATCAECMLLLSKALPWKSAVTVTLSQCLQKHPQDMDLSSIFGLLVISGFPRIPREGGVVHTTQSDKPSQVVLLKVDSNNASGIDINARKPVQIKLSDYEFEDSVRGCIDESKLETLLSLLKLSLQLFKQESDRQVEHTWILALVLKAFHFIIQTSTSLEVIRQLQDTGLIPTLVKLASKPTNVSKKWFLTDLEVLGISSYLPRQDVAKEETKSPQQEKEATPPPEEKEEEEDNGDDEDEDKDAKEEDAILEGLDDEHKFMLKTMTEVFLCDLTVLRAMYDDVDGDMAKFMASTEECCKDGEFKPTSEILEASKKWKMMNMEGANSQDLSMSMEDTGVTRISPIELNIKTIEALPEDSSIFKKTKNLLKETEKQHHHGTGKHISEEGALKREDSYKLLWEELGKKEPLATRESLCKTIQGVAVLRARLVLATLLSKWPKDGPRLSTTFLGCSDIIHYFCLLDLLLHQQTTKEKEKLLLTVLTCGEETEIVSLAIIAAQCMNKVAISKEIRVFTHKGQAEGKLEESGKIVINNATSLNITYHPVNGMVEFASSENMSEHHKKLTGSATKQTDEEKYIVPGDTLYYKVELESVSEAKYPRYSFTVTGTQEGRFDTGFVILRLLMDRNQPFVEWLPLIKLWPLLITVACQHTGKERLKVVTLLMEVINLQSKDGGRGVDNRKNRLELSALKPLWQLYTTIIKDYDAKTKTNKTLSPELVRVLTEVFLYVENLSEEWGTSQELMVETLTKEGLNMWLEKGISNVAYVSLALGLDNLASRTFIEEKKNYKPPPEVVEAKSSAESVGHGGRISEDDGEDDEDEELDDDDDDDEECDSYETYSESDY